MIPVATLDAAMLLAETAEMPLHNLGVMLFDPPPPSDATPFEAMHAMIAARVHRVAPFRRKLVPGRWGLADLRWIDDPDFDLRRHLRHVTLPAPGGAAELRAFVGEYAARLLARDKPLWEVTLVDGLASGEVASVSKIHHAAMDGMQLAALVGDLFDHSPDEAREPSPHAPLCHDREPGALRLALAGMHDLASKPGKVLRAARDIAGSSSPSGQPRAPDEAPRLAVPRTPWGGALSRARSVAFADVALDDVRTIGATFGTTVNDVVLAACTATLRSWLSTHDAAPSRSLVANVPIALGPSRDEAGNHVSMLRVGLPMHALDPVARLMRIHAATSRGKRRHHASGADTYRRLADIALGLTVPALVTSAIGFYSRHHGADHHPAFWNLVISNVPGPREALYCGGARLRALYPFGPVQHGSGLNLTVMSAAGRLGLGVIACPDKVPDVEDLAAGFVDEIALLMRRVETRSF